MASRVGLEPTTYGLWRCISDLNWNFRLATIRCLMLPLFAFFVWEVETLMFFNIANLCFTLN